jgi:hypothetical protein
MMQRSARIINKPIDLQSLVADLNCPKLQASNSERSNKREKNLFGLLFRSLTTGLLIGEKAVSNEK